MTTATSTIRTADDFIARSFRVRGLVQGVGFRPTVWRIANELGLTGDVRNDGEGVLINLFANSESSEQFTRRLLAQCPPLARIDTIEQIPCDNDISNTDFQIIESAQTEIATGIIADAATCSDCLHELNEPSDRRFQYPFLNCTHCGPRFSIIRHIPYDRASTSMSGFELCDDCLREYLDPADRRFHAQPTACAKCGPAIWLCNSQGDDFKAGLHNTAAVIKETARQLKQGAIVAIKGIGGIHLACDASNSEAVARLRQRKNRPHKPLAMMARDLQQVRHYCEVHSDEAEALNSPAAPIVILQASDSRLLPDNIAPGQKQWGFMLPYSPLHHLLLSALDEAIVLTSGNRSDEPQCTDNEDAVERLSDIADCFLLHDRPIENRIDDSVVRRMDGQLQLLRRARGYAPGHIQLPAGFADHPPLLALGGELKNTFCLLKNGQAILSQHMGNLEDARTFEDYRKNLGLYLELYAHKPEILAADNHPEYLSSKLGLEWADDNELTLLQIQHHHAHIAACMLDNQIDLHEGAVIGVAFDGLGFGDDATLWGGEFLIADYEKCNRIAHLKPVAMPGGVQAMHEPWRNTWAQLSAAIGWHTFTEKYSALELSRTLSSRPVATLQQMQNKGINSPLSSSAGRLFDAVAAAAGVAPAHCSFEGQAAMALEAEIDNAELKQDSFYRFSLSRETGIYQLDPTPLWVSLLDDLQTGCAASIIAARFHRGFAEAIIGTATLLARENNLSRIALSGGVFQNRTLLELVVAGLKKNKLQVLTHHQVPANDGGLALGQAAIAAAREINKAKAFMS